MTGDAIDFVLSLVSDEYEALFRGTEALAAGSLGELDARTGESSELNRDILHSLSRSGLLDWTVPRAYGSSQGELCPDALGLAAGSPDGAPLSLVPFCLIREALARSCPHAELVFTMQGLGAGPISLYGSETQKRDYLPRVSRGELAAAFALTEPQAGSDVGALELRADKLNETYVLDGRKTLISMAPDADLYTVFARTDPGAGNKGLSCFIVQKGCPGFDPGRRMELLAPHPIGEPIFTECRIAEEMRVGDENSGFRVAMGTLDFFRTTVGASALGLAQAALDASVARSTRRRAFGRPIAEFQATQLKLAQMATELAAARLMVYRAAIMGDRSPNERHTLVSAQAKLYATEAAQRIIDQAVQLHGGAGLIKGALVERLYRQIRALRIYEGTSEIQHLVIARQILSRAD